MFMAAVHSYSKVVRRPSPPASGWRRRIRRFPSRWSPPNGHSPSHGEERENRETKGIEMPPHASQSDVSARHWSHPLAKSYGCHAKTARRRLERGSLLRSWDSPVPFV